MDYVPPPEREAPGNLLVYLVLGGILFVTLTLIIVLYPGLAEKIPFHYWEYFS